MNRFLTSNNNYSISITINADRIFFGKLPCVLKCNEKLIFLTDVQGNEINKQVIPKHSENFTYRIPRLHDGIYSLNIFYRPETFDMFWSYICKYQILLEIKSAVTSFKSYSVCLSNSVKFSTCSKRWNQQNCLLPSSEIQSSNIEIRQLASDIARGKLLNYSKVLAIHDWVADNIFYDNDSIKDGSYRITDSSALGTLRTRRNVCQGYSNLSIALLRSIGIPSCEVPCYALGVSSEGGWDRKENLTNEANHVITAAFVDDRWLLMDVTWDSDNKYDNGMYSHKTGLGVSHKYFDPTLFFISNTHRFTL